MLSSRNQLPLLIVLTLFGTIGVRADLVDGLQGYWSFEGGFENLGCAEGGDLTGELAFLTNGAPGGSTPNQAYRFNGSNGLDTGLTPDDLNIADGDFTVAAWICVNGMDANWQSPVSEEGDRFRFGVNNGALGINTDTNGTFSERPIERDQWTHIAGVGDEDGMLGLYINGQHASKTPPVPGFPKMDMGNLNIGDQFNGDIDDVAIWDRILSGDEIEALASGASPQALPQGDPESFIYTGPYGEGGTWNVYQVGGVVGSGMPQTDWSNAQSDAASMIDPVASTGTSGSLFEADSTAEQNFAWDIAGGLDPIFEGGMANRVINQFAEQDTVAAGSHAAFVIEFQTNLPEPPPGAQRLAKPVFPDLGIPTDGMVRARMLQSNQFIFNFEDAVQVNAEGTIVADFDPPTINHVNSTNANPTGNFGDDLHLPNPPGNDDDFTTHFQGVFYVSPSEGGIHTFFAQSDDGFGFQLPGQVIEKTAGKGSVHASDPCLAYFPGPNANTDTRIVVSLEPGNHRFNFVTFNGTGDTFAELSAARGDWTEETDTSHARLFNHQAAPTINKLGVDANGWTVTMSQPGGNALFDLNMAILDIDNFAISMTNHDTLHFTDPQNAGSGNFGPAAAFPNDTVRDDDHFALFAEAKLVVPSDGTYHIGFQGDDGAFLEISGQTFSSIVEDATGQAAIANSGQRIQCDCLTGNSRTVGEISLLAGTYDIIVVYFEADLGAYFEVFASEAGGASCLLETNGAMIASDVPGLPLVDGHQFPGDLDGDGIVDINDLKELIPNAREDDDRDGWANGLETALCFDPNNSADSPNPFLGFEMNNGILNAIIHLPTDLKPGWKVDLFQSNDLKQWDLIDPTDLESQDLGNGTTRWSAGNFDGESPADFREFLQLSSSFNPG